MKRSAYNSKIQKKIIESKKYYWLYYQKSFNHQAKKRNL